VRISILTAVDVVTEPPFTKTTGTAVAEIVSQVLNPLVLPPLLFGGVGLFAGASGYELAWLMGLSILFFTVVPLLFLLWQHRLGLIDSLDIRDRTRRALPLIATIMSYVVGAGVLALHTTPGAWLIALLMGCYAINTALTMLVTQAWKISIHVLSIAGIPSILSFLWCCLTPGHGGLNLPLLIGGSSACIPLVAWARVRLRHHTVSQVIAGALGGLLLPFAELWLLQAAGVPLMLP